jgi:hypothetical protein
VIMQLKNECNKVLKEVIIVVNFERPVRMKDISHNRILYKSHNNV